jgi:hypothetical protein
VADFCKVAGADDGDSEIVAGLHVGGLIRDSEKNHDLWKDCDSRCFSR